MEETFLKKKKKKDIFAQASRRSRLNINKKERKEGRKNEGFGVRDRKNVKKKKKKTC